MKKIAILILSTSLFLIIESCNKYPLKITKDSAVGTVIDKETCNADLAKDYWLINIFSSPSAKQQYGDTIILNGTKYTNVIKVKGLPENLKKIGQKVGFDFKMEEAATLTTNCTSNTPILYKLKLAEVTYSSPASF